MKFDKYNINGLFMKINNLLESITTASSPENATNSAPTMGRSDKFLEDEHLEETSAGATGSGSVASVASPVGGTQRRGKGSMFQGIKTSEKYPNSKAVKEGKNSELDSLYDQYDELDYDGNSESDKEKMRHIQQKIKDLKAKEKKVNESQINEVDPRNFDSDVDYYAARNAPAKPRYRGTSSPGVNPDDEAYFREIFRKKRLAAQQAERTADHDRLATGTNEGLESDSELKTWQVVIFNNYYAGKYSDYRGRYYYVLATSPEEAKQVVLDNADGILQELLAMKSHNGKKILPRSSAVRITSNRIGKIEDGTVAGRMSTAGFKKMFGPQGPMMVKLSGGAVQDIQGQEQGVTEMDGDGAGRDGSNRKRIGSYGTRDRDIPNGPDIHLGKESAMTHQQVQDRFSKELDKAFNATQPRKTMGLNASLEQHADDKMKELGHKFKPVAEAGGRIPSGLTWTGGKIQKRPELVAAARQKKNRDAAMKRKALKVANAVVDLVAKDSAIQNSNEPYRAAMYELGFEEMDGSTWWKMVMKAIDNINSELPQNQGVAEAEGMSRRGFLKGLGAAAAAGVAGSAMGQSAKRPGDTLPSWFGPTGQREELQSRFDRMQLGQKINFIVKPRITYSGTMDVTNPTEVEILCAPDGTIVGVKLLKSSNNDGWDAAVLKAVEKTEHLPSDENGKIHPRIRISFSPQERVNEKSKSQAQFRTMAAVAHNPEFAKKVGISQKVGKEFHSADRKQNYKDLPKEVDEEKEKGADGKACWDGYRYNGTENGSDKCVKVSEAEVSEDKIAQDLYKDLQIFKKGADKEIGPKAKDKEISSKAKDKEIIAKVTNK
jgi:TonB family protein